VKLAVFSHKPCWRSPTSPSGFATDGGFPFQIQYLSQLFDETRLLVPIVSEARPVGEIPLWGSNLRIVPLTVRRGAGLASKLSFVPWLVRNGPCLMRELIAADSVHTPIPGDVGTIGMLGAAMLRKPLFVRHCGNWTKPATLAEKFWRWFMERHADRRNVMLATGGASQPPSLRNPNVRWIFSSSLTDEELATYGCPRCYPKDGRVRLVIVARQEPDKGAAMVIRSLPLLASNFPGTEFEIVGDGTAIPSFRTLARQLGVLPRVTFTGKLNHTQVMQRLQEATLFAFPTTSSEGFPKAVLEALATGLPVLATRVSVLPQLLGQGCGVLLEEATPQAVAQGVERVLQSPSEYEAMSRKAVETARQYSLEAWRDEIRRHLEAAWGPLNEKQKAESRKQKLLSP